MNINFNPFIKVTIPFFIVITFTYFLNSLLYFYLPKVGIEQPKTNLLELDYNRYDIKKAFDLIKKIPKEEVKATPQKVEYELLSNLTLRAIYATEGNNGWIIIAENKTNITHILSKGEKFKEYTLTKIFSTYVIFTKDSKEYKLEMIGTEKLDYEIVSKNEKEEIEEKIKVEGNDVKVTRNYLNSYVNDMSKIWNNIAIQEIFKNGKIDGFKINNIKQGSAFEKLGLKTGDIIKSVNNTELKSYNDAFKVYNKINTINYLNIKIIRNNTEMEINYEIN